MFYKSVNSTSLTPCKIYEYQIITVVFDCIHLYYLFSKKYNSLESDQSIQACFKNHNGKSE